MLDVWFLGQIDYRTIEHPWIINEITNQDVAIQNQNVKLDVYSIMYSAFPTSGSRPKQVFVFTEESEISSLAYFTFFPDRVLIGLVVANICTV